MAEQLGSGNFAVVKKATKTDKNKKEGIPHEVAIKIIDKSKVEDMGDIEREIEIMNMIEHKNVVNLYELYDEPKKMNLVMELVTGGDLSAPFNEKRNVPEAELRVWLRGLTLGLEHLHLSGVCHRDIKPENLLWDPRYQQVSEAAGIIAQSDKSSYSLAHSKNTPVLLCLCVPGQADRLWHLRLRQDRYDGRRLFDIHGRLDALFRARDVQSAQWCGL